MTEIAAPVPAQPFALAPPAAAAVPAAQAEDRSVPVRRSSRLRRLAAAVADTHRAAVPF